MNVVIFSALCFTWSMLSTTEIKLLLFYSLLNIIIIKPHVVYPPGFGDVSSSAARRAYRGRGGMELISV